MSHAHEPFTPEVLVTTEPRDDANPPEQDAMLDEVARRQGRDPVRARAVREVAAREEAERLAEEDFEAAVIQAERRIRERREEVAALAAVALPSLDPAETSPLDLSVAEQARLAATTGKECSRCGESKLADGRENCSAKCDAEEAEAAVDRERWAEDAKRDRERASAEVDRARREDLGGDR